MRNNTISMEPVQKNPLYIKISDAIYNYIRINNLKPNDKLPPEREMAAMLNTSRTTVREAIRVLENKGVIYVKTGSGMFVREQFEAEKTIDIELMKYSMRDIKELLFIINQRTVLNAIERADISQKNKLVEIAKELYKLSEMNIYSHFLDHEYHNLIYEMSENKMMQQVVITLRQEMYKRHTDNHIDDEKWLPTVIDHLNLAKAISCNDVKSALFHMEIIDNFDLH